MKRTARTFSAGILPALLFPKGAFADAVLCRATSGGFFPFFLAGALLLLFLLLLWLRRSGRLLFWKNRTVRNESHTLEAFLEGQGDIAYLKDEKLRYVYANSATKRLYGEGIQDSDIIGRDDFSIPGTDFAYMRRQTDLDALAAGRVTKGVVPHNGRIYQTTKFPMPLANGKRGIGACIRDITLETRFLRRKEMASQRLSILSAVVAHTFSSVQEQLDYVLEEAAALTESAYGYLFLYDEGTEKIKMSACTKSVLRDSEAAPGPRECPLSDTGAWADAIRKRQPVIVDAFTPESAPQHDCPIYQLPITRFVSVPVLMDRKIVAAVLLTNKKDPYEEADAFELALLMTGVWSDMRRREVRARLNYERLRYLQTLVSIGEGVLVVDGQGKIEILSVVAEKLTGFTGEEAIGRPYAEVFTARYAGPDPIDETLRTGASTAASHEFVLVSRGGAEYAIEGNPSPIRDAGGNVQGVVLVFRDMTQKKAQMARVEYLSFHDPLTGLFNRRYLTDAIARLEADEANLPLSVVMGDLNGLKLTNDVFGHAAGDELLKKIAAVLADVCRPGDVVGRWGGDEFVMLLPKTDGATAATVAARVKATFGSERVRVVRGSISMGYACKERMETSAMMAFSMAEDAMYNAKSLESGEAYRFTLSEIVHSLHAANDRERTHAEAVRDLSGQIAGAMGLSAGEVRKASEAGFLHDVGKIALDAGLLGATHSPTACEWNEIRRHPSVGYRILNAFEETASIAEPVLAHHERWNSTGYPRGMKGEQIPLLARVLSVAEAYDRMTRDARGAQAFLRGKAIEELRKSAGEQFDPAVVAAFVRMLETSEGAKECVGSAPDRPFAR